MVKRVFFWSQEQPTEYVSAETTSNIIIYYYCESFCEFLYLHWPKASTTAATLISWQLNGRWWRLAVDLLPFCMFCFGIFFFVGVTLTLKLTHEWNRFLLNFNLMSFCAQLQIIWKKKQNKMVKINSIRNWFSSALPLPSTSPPSRNLSNCVIYCALWCRDFNCKLLVECFSTTWNYHNLYNLHEIWSFDYAIRLEPAAFHLD